MNQDCLNCQYSQYLREQQCYCHIYDDIVLETDYCGLWGNENDI